MSDQRSFRIAACVAAMAISGAALFGQPQPAKERPADPPPADPALMGETLARQVCASCHLFPEPDLLDKKCWEQQILPRMETRMGVSPPDYSSSPEGPLLKSLGIYPTTAMVTKEQWASIVEYYLAKAPEKPLPQDPRPEIKVTRDKFDVNVSRFRYAPPLTTLVKITSEKTVLMGDERTRRMAFLGGDGRPVEALQLDNVPIAFQETEGGVYVTAIGSIIPSEVQNASLYFLEKVVGEYRPPKVLLKNLPRATHTEAADFNGDGKMDFAMCLFGNHRGRFSWYENQGNDQYKENILFEKSGAIHCAAHDFNKDGKPDLALLVSQETEAFYIFINDGKGGFASHLVFQQHPLFGHNYFELADFNGDGQADLLVANGDNAEYESPLKKYHGLRIYLNKGNYRFEHAWFFPLNGATKAMARDFDLDGDLDIAAISYFPDYENAPRESFVFLENKGGFQFSPSTFPECVSGHWITMDAGDADGDGDMDIALGSYIRGPMPVPVFLSKTWETNSPSVLLLRNLKH